MFLSKRNLLSFFNRATKSCKFLKDAIGIKIALPQDEFYYTNELNDFIITFNIDYIFSVSPETEWKKIYPDVNRNRVKIAKALTGYLEEKTINLIESLSKESLPRDIDVGYRSTPLRFSLGRHGYMKGKIAEVFINECRKYDLITDISTQPKDTKLGMEWYRFLLRCKYFIGVESGASLLDQDGSIYHKVNTFLEKNPRASFEEAEKNCFEGMDGNLNLFAISPRHLEACATRTCQILMEGSYDGILKPNIHYIPFKKDFSNIHEVLQKVKEDELREKIVTNAYRDIVASKKWTYREFVRSVLETCGFHPDSGTEISLKDRHLYNKNLRREKWIWSIIPIQSRLIEFAVSIFPHKIMASIVKYIETSRN
jgi:hypothetical protein